MKRVNTCEYNRKKVAYEEHQIADQEIRFIYFILIQSTCTSAAQLIAAPLAAWVTLCAANAKDYM